jgi:hypothetical protein
MTKHKQEIKNYLGTFSMVVMSLIKSVHYARFLRHALTSQIKKNQQEIATGQIKTATRSKLIIFETRETQTKALKMKNRKSKCLNHLTALTVSNLKCHIIYFSRGFHNNQ